MEESPHQDRRLEVLRASCVGQPHEMINLFFAPFKSMTTEQRIDRALDRLRQIYGVSDGFLSEPKVLEIRKSSKITRSITSLKSFNEDLNNARGICICTRSSKKAFLKIIARHSKPPARQLKATVFGLP